MVFRHCCTQAGADWCRLALTAAAALLTRERRAGNPHPCACSSLTLHGCLCALLLCSALLDNDDDDEWFNFAEADVQPKPSAKASALPAKRTAAPKSAAEMPGPITEILDDDHDDEDEDDDDSGAYRCKSWLDLWGLQKGAAPSPPACLAVVLHCNLLSPQYFALLPATLQSPCAASSLS